MFLLRFFITRWIRFSKVVPSSIFTAIPHTPHFLVLLWPDSGGMQVTGARREFNLRMSKMRTAVENAFGLTQNLWTE